MLTSSVCTLLPHTEQAALVTILPDAVPAQPAESSLTVVITESEKLNLTVPILELDSNLKSHWAIVSRQPGTGPATIHEISVNRMLPC